MDWQDKLIKLYLFNDKYYHSRLWIHSQRFSNNGQPGFSDVEVMTVYLWGLLRGFCEIKKIYRYTADHLRQWFPELPSYVSYINRLNRLCSVFQAWLEHLRDDFPVLKGLMNIALIDSMPVIMARGSRRYTAKVAAELAGPGYCPTKKLYYHGMKIHLIAFKREGALPVPDYLSVSGGDEHDLNILKRLAHEFHDTEIYADKAYCDSWTESLLEQRDTKLFTPVKRKKGEPYPTLFKRVFSSMVSRVRQPVESFFNWLEQKTGVQNASRVRSTKGLLTHIFGRLVAAFMLLLADF